MNVTQDGVHTLTTNIQGIIPDPTDPNQDPSNANFPTPWTLNSPFNPTLTTTGSTFTSTVCGTCTRFLVTVTLQTGNLGDAGISSFSNTFRMQQVPEPATMGDRKSVV